MFLSNRKTFLECREAFIWPRNYFSRCVVSSNYFPLGKPSHIFYIVQRQGGSRGAVGRGGRLTSLDASFMRCFVFFSNIVKNIEVDVFFKTSLKHRIVKQKVRCFPQCFRFQKGHSESELNKQVRASQS